MSRLGLLQTPTWAIQSLAAVLARLLCLVPCLARQARAIGLGRGSNSLHKRARGLDVDLVRAVAQAIGAGRPHIGLVLSGVTRGAIVCGVEVVPFDAHTSVVLLAPSHVWVTIRAAAARS